MALSLTTPPTGEPVTLADVKLYIDEVRADRDTLIQGLIATARMHVERVTRRPLLTQRWTLTLDGFSGDRIYSCGNVLFLPKPPVTSIVSVSYVDTNGTTQALADVTDYRKSLPSGPTAAKARLEPAYGKSWPSTRDVMDAVTIVFECGYGASGGLVPAPIRTAIQQLVAHWYERPEPVSDVSLEEMPFAVTALLRPYVVY